MPINYTVTSLPQGAIVITEFEPEHMYTLPAGKTYCFPFKMRRYYNQVVVDMADISPFESCFIPMMRSWPSKEAAAQSMTDMPLASQAFVTLGPSGVKWNFWLLDQVKPSDQQESDINRGILPDTFYWINIQNLQNRPSYFWLRFTYYGPAGTTHID